MFLDTESVGQCGRVAATWFNGVVHVLNTQ